MFFQGAYAPGGGGSDSELRASVMAKLLWDVNADAEALVNEWMTGVYGRHAARPMRQWFDLLHAKARSDPNLHFFIFDGPSVGYLTADVLEAGERLFDEAARLAGDDATAAEYVAKARLTLRYVRLAQRPRAGAELDQFLADCRRFGLTQLREGQGIDDWEKAYRAAVAAAATQQAK